MIIVTGAAGFIGSNIVKGLNNAGREDILAVDDLTDGIKFENLAGLKIADYMDKDDFLESVRCGADGFSEKIEAIIHQGACSATTEWDGKYMMKNNYEYSKELMHFCINNRIPFIYASSAAVYGSSTNFKEILENELPLNVYGYSKWQFDQYVRRMRHFAQSQIVGLRYFNVYGPREQHKEAMASVAFHLMNQLKETGKMKLFEGSGQYGNGEQLRDFIFVADVVNVVLWFLENSDKSGIFNVGTGNARSFNDIAVTLKNLYGKGKIEYIPFPKKLKEHYQSYTQAEITDLREIGYDQAFTSLEDGIAKYYKWRF